MDKHLLNTLTRRVRKAGIRAVSRKSKLPLATVSNRVNGHGRFSVEELTTLAKAVGLRLTFVEKGAIRGS